MTSYACNTSNKFGLSLSDEDDFEDPSQVFVRALTMKPTPPPLPAAAAVVKSQVKKAPTKEDKKGQTVRGAPRGNTRGRGTRPFNGRGGNNKTPTNEDSPSLERGQQPSRNNRGRGGPGRGARGGRQFDRHSGSDRTGVRSVEKKGGHGKGNWGEPLEAAVEVVEETEAPAVVEEGEETQEPPVAREKTPRELEYEAFMEAQSKLKTLSEYKAEQKAETSEFKTRKAGEGSSSDFPKLVPMKKHEIEEPKEEEVTFVRKESNKKVLQFEFNIASREKKMRTNERNSRPPSNRGGGRGRGRGGKHSPKPSWPTVGESHQPAPDVC